MLSRSKLQLLSSLQNKKFRQQYGQFLVEGDKIVREALNQKRFRVLEVLALPDWFDETEIMGINLLHALQSKVSAKDMARISSLKNPPPVFALLELPRDTEIIPADPRGLVLFLDGIQDPGNAGTIVRTAEWFGVEHVVLSPDSVDRFHPKFLQACMGSVFRTHVYELSWTDLRAQLPKYPCWGTAADGQKSGNLDQEPGILVLGNEGRGIRPEIMNQLDGILTIPRKPNSGAESLNVAVAAGILLEKLHG